MRLLKQVAAEKRIQPEDVAWLSTEAPDCWTEKLQQAWHRVEALALSEEWERTSDVWAAVNASGHWRKADQPGKALELTGAALAISGLAGKPKSALSTTRGGAMRDVGRLAEAKKLGLDAHMLTPTDFRPCTLIGAVSMELGDLAAGHDWYTKAEELGAERGAIDHELRSLLVRSNPDAQERLRAFLLAQDCAPPLHQAARGVHRDRRAERGVQWPRRGPSRRRIRAFPRLQGKQGQESR
ncbi:MAG: hypothetical protein KDJ82_09945 [Rhodobacteraceae bacterium]|nr:hypothetical protein [Paracoccaceae bacterium]